jgi:hypothetical protein
MVLLEGYVVACGGLRAQKRCGPKPPSTTSAIMCLNDIRSLRHLHSHSLYRSTFATCIFHYTSPTPYSRYLHHIHTSSHLFTSVLTGHLPLSTHPTSPLDACLHVSLHDRWVVNHSSEAIHKYRWKLTGSMQSVLSC